MKKKQIGRLTLHRETIQRLNPSDLMAVAGADTWGPCGSLHCDDTYETVCEKCPPRY